MDFIDLFAEAVTLRLNPPRCHGDVVDIILSGIPEHTLDPDQHPIILKKLRHFRKIIISRGRWRLDFLDEKSFLAFDNTLVETQAHDGIVDITVVPMSIFPMDRSCSCPLLYRGFLQVV